MLVREDSKNTRHFLISFWDFTDKYCVTEIYEVWNRLPMWNMFIVGSFNFHYFNLQILPAFFDANLAKQLANRDIGLILPIHSIATSGLLQFSPRPTHSEIQLYELNSVEQLQIYGSKHQRK